MTRFNIALLILAAIFALPSCDGLEENYSSNPSYRLSFSTDTISFDTIFSSVGSATKQFMIYNTNKEPLNIESIMLASGESTGFRINVDGRKGSKFNDIAIMDNDSLYVLVEVTVDPNGKEQPLLIEDSILFNLNGIKQRVILEAYGQDVNIMRGGVMIDRDSTLRANRPYLIYDSLVIAPNSSLNVEKGATLYMHDKAKIIVEGSVKLIGTKEKPITLRGDRLDYLLDGLLPYDKTPGLWDGIVFKPGSFDNIMVNTIIRNGTNGIRCEASTTNIEKLKIVDSQVTNMERDLLHATNCDIKIMNSELSNAGGSVVTLIGGKYQFTHCTLANYMSLTRRGFSDGEIPLESKTLHLIDPDRIEEQGFIELEKARFDNCIIDGSLDEEISIFDENGNGIDYIFNHCLIKGKKRDDMRFNSAIFMDNIPSYRMLGDKTDKYAFDFRPDSATSVMVGKADPEIVKEYPYDRYGINRVSNSAGASIGAYEFTEPEKRMY